MTLGETLRHETANETRAGNQRNPSAASRKLLLSTRQLRMPLADEVKANSILHDPLLADNAATGRGAPNSK
jgi:hypothetical protein